MKYEWKHGTNDSQEYYEATVNGGYLNDALAFETEGYTIYED